MTDEQKDALKSLITGAAMNVAMLRWNYERGNANWDCREHHNYRLDKEMAQAATFGDWAKEYYAMQYTLVCEKPVGHMK